ncbi:MAG: PEGA domain-containing protein [Calditrichaeota bacterium]|nr:PEGA domain-containing protein [Calditrichota bacterium]MCB9066922.1 PEGA domain-containing protein [Calditrichia bacterium]
MALTPEEEKQLRDQIREKLEKRLERSQENQDDSNAARQAKLEERLRQQIREEEEEKFYSDRGYVKYTNHRGGIEWLTPEEAEHRRSKRRTTKGSSRRKLRKRQKWVRWAVNAAAIATAFAVFAYVWRYNPNPQVSAGTLVIESEVPGAHVFINGIERRDEITPLTLPDMSTGSYFISIYKEGFAAWPPMQKVVLENGKTAAVSFEMKNVGKMGMLQIDVNQTDVDVYVDGIKMPVADLAAMEIPVGHHIISVVKNGYLATPQYHRVLVNENGVTNVQFSMEKSDVGYLKISSNRASGFVYLSNKMTGIKANGQAFPVAEGVYEIRIVENNYISLPEKELVRISAGETVELSFHLQQSPTLDTLNLLSDRPGDNIILNGEVLPYVTPISDLVLNDGVNFINLMRNGQLLAEKDEAVDVANLKDRRLQLNF